MKNYQMIQYLHKNSIILLCTQIYKKRGIYSKNINKRTDKCHKAYIQNNYILALIKSPQLETLFVLKQSQVNLKTQNMIIKESRINKFLKQKTNVWFKQKRTRQNKYLPPFYNDNILTK